MDKLRSLLHLGHLLVLKDEVAGRRGEIAGPRGEIAVRCGEEQSAEVESVRRRLGGVEGGVQNCF
jgi:hypothetical protein